MWRATDYSSRSLKSPTHLSVGSESSSPKPPIFPESWEKIAALCKKSKNQPNFWSFWSYTFIFGEDGAYFIYKIRKNNFWWKNIFFDPKNRNSEKHIFINFEIWKISKSKFQNIKIVGSWVDRNLQMSKILENHSEKTGHRLFVQGCFPSG